MKTLLLLFLCVHVSVSQDNLDYDSYDTVSDVLMFPQQSDLFHVLIGTIKETQSVRLNSSFDDITVTV